MTPCLEYSPERQTRQVTLTQRALGQHSPLAQLLVGKILEEEGVELLTRMWNTQNRSRFRKGNGVHRWKSCGRGEQSASSTNLEP